MARQRGISVAGHRRWVVALLALLGGCAQPELPEDHYYRLDIALPASRPSGAVLAGSLMVERMGADGLIAGRPIVFSDARDRTTLREYHYHLWVEPPPVLVRDQLVGCLRAAGVARAVVTPEVRIEPDYVMTGKIRRLERIVGSDSRAVVELDIAVRQGAGNRVLLLKTFREEEPVTADNVAAAVRALNGALGRLCAKLVVDLAAARP